MSAEPSMEEILSSIKRIIAEEGESPIRGRRVGRVAPVGPPPLERDDEEDEAEILELSHPIPPAPADVDPPAQHGRAASPMPMAAPIRPLVDAVEPIAPNPVHASMSEQAPPAEPILSVQAAAASRTALDSLSRLVVKPEATADATLEGLVREMLRPMLREWLDANLPAMVETMVQAEITRITASPR